MYLESHFLTYPNNLIKRLFFKSLSILIIVTHLSVFTLNGLSYQDIGPRVEDLKQFIKEFASLVDDLLVKKCYADFEPPESATFQAGGLKNFQADLYTGGARYRLPIEVLQGRNGIQPNLSLNYFSNSGNGWCGVGWNLEIPSISRSTKWGVPNYDNSDTLIYNSGDAQIELVNIGGNEYRTEIEGEFLKFIFDGSFWQMYDKSGKRYFFGSADNSRQTNPSGTFKWGLDKVIDLQGPSLNGNYMTISYFKDQGQIYPDQIQYTGNQDSGDSPYATVDFISESRTDVPSSYITAHSVVTAYRLKEIDIKVDGNRVRKYLLDYNYSSKTNRSLLESVMRYGSDNLTILSTLSFNYATDSGFDSGSEWRNSFSGFTPVLGNFNGDGMTDVGIVEVFNPIQWKTALSDGTSFTSPQTWLSVGHPYASHDNYTTVSLPADFNGDGLTDAGFSPYWIYFNFPGDSTITWRWDVGLSTSSNFANSNVWLGEQTRDLDDFGGGLTGDFNGDGMTDAGNWFKQDSSNRKFLVYLSNGSQFVEDGYWISNITKDYKTFSGVLKRNFIWIF